MLTSALRIFFDEWFMVCSPFCLSFNKSLGLFNSPLLSTFSAVLTRFSFYSVPLSYGYIVPNNEKNVKEKVAQILGLNLLKICASCQHCATIKIWNLSLKHAKTQFYCNTKVSVCQLLFLHKI